MGLSPHSAEVFLDNFSSHLYVRFPDICQSHRHPFIHVCLDGTLKSVALLVGVNSNSISNGSDRNKLQGLHQVSEADNISETAFCEHD
jgi:hypothetical protein